MTVTPAGDCVLKLEPRDTNLVRLIWKARPLAAAGPFGPRPGVCAELESLRPRTRLSVFVVVVLRALVV